MFLLIKAEAQEGNKISFIKLVVLLTEAEWKKAWKSPLTRCINVLTVVLVAADIDVARWLCFKIYPKHYTDVIMTTIASQITSFTIVYSIVYSDADQRKHQSSDSLAIVREFTGTGEFPAQRVSNAENVSIWWRLHDQPQYWLYVATTTKCYDRGYKLLTKRFMSDM